MIMLVSHLSESFSLGVLLEAECREVHAASEDLGFRQNTHTADTVDLHFHVGVAVRVAEVSKMRAPCGVLCVALDDDGVFVQSVGEREGSLGLLPTVQVVRLFASEPVR